MAKLDDYMASRQGDSEKVAAAEILGGEEITPLRARALRSAIEVAAESLDDATISEYPELCPAWEPGKSYEAGTRVQYNGAVYTVLQDHTSQGDWAPGDAPSLFSAVLPGQGGTEIGEWVQPESTNPYMKGDRVTHNGKTWESTIDNNVWEPGVYGWTEVEA